MPEEGTTDQALMYIPSENVYYELIVNTPEIEEYAKNKNVIMASPNTLNYFLKVLLVAFQQHELEKHAGDILKSLSGIKVEAEKFETDLSVLDRHVSNAGKSMDNVRTKFDRKPNYVIFNMYLSYDIQKQSKYLIPKEHIKEPDVFWSI